MYPHSVAPVVPLVLEEEDHPFPGTREFRVVDPGSQVPLIDMRVSTALMNDEFFIFLRRWLGRARTGERLRLVE